MKIQTKTEKTYPIKVNFENAEILIYTMRLSGRRTITEMVKQREIQPPVMPSVMTAAQYRKMLATPAARTGRAVGHFENAQIVVYTVTLSDGRSFTRNTEKRKLSVVSTAPVRKVMAPCPVAMAYVARFRLAMKQQQAGGVARL